MFSNSFVYQLVINVMPDILYTRVHLQKSKHETFILPHFHKGTAFVFCGFCGAHEHVTVKAAIRVPSSSSLLARSATGC